jgi:hypothetical protein
MTNEEKVWILTNMRYDAETGKLERWFRDCKWKECSGKPVSSGYATVCVLGVTQKYHRVCWLLAHGEIDDELSIDHENGNRTDNRLVNLRLGTTRENDQNKECHRNGKLCGCYWEKESEKWKAQIVINGKNKYLGRFNTEQEAHEAYQKVVASLSLDS